MKRGTAGNPSHPSTTKENMMTLVIYLVGWIILIGGVCWALVAAHVSQHHAWGRHHHGRHTYPQPGPLIAVQAFAVKIAPPGRLAKMRNAKRCYACIG
jgi:hypothetical protein